MRFQGVDIEGSIHIQRLDTMPEWQPSDMGRLIYAKDDKLVYYGTNEGWSRATGFGLSPVYVSSDYIADEQEMLLVDTRDGAITITLPESPKLGAEISIIDVAGTFESNYCILTPNGNTIQRLEKDLVLDINDFTGSLIFDSISNTWKVSIEGVVQVFGNATIVSNKALITAEDVDGYGNQQVFTLPWHYDITKNNISVFVSGVKQFTFEKTDTNIITLAESVPAGTEVEFCSIPFEGSYNVDSIATVEYIDEKISDTNSNINTAVDALEEKFNTKLTTYIDKSTFTDDQILALENLKISNPELEPIISILLA